MDRHTTNVDLTDIVVAANILAHRDDEDDSDEIEWDDISATRQLELNEATAIELVQESEEQIQSIISALEG